MKRWTSTKVMVEGHADSRGSNEYNLALGERRADAARDYLVSLGIAADRVTIVSKGEEAAGLHARRTRPAGSRTAAGTSCSRRSRTAVQAAELAPRLLGLALTADRAVHCIRNLLARPGAVWRGDDRPSHDE